jgi:anti-sigma regulatory factor (Ser/Thr protein kinase)
MTADPTSASGDLVVPSVPQSVARIRRHAAACAAAHPGVDLDTLLLLVSEVATNALVHGSGDVRVRVLAAGDRLRVEVDDGSGSMPAPREARDDAEGGRGLALVQALATRWGADPRTGGKTVWFELSAAVASTAMARQE